MEEYVMRKRILFFGSVVTALMFLIASTGPAMAKTLRFQSIWPASIQLNKGDKYFTDLVDVLCEDEVNIDYNDGGSLVSTSEVFDAVSQGMLDMATDWPSYWDGKNTAFSLITSVPMGFTPADYMIWYWQGGGLELAQELYGKYDIVWIPHAVTGPESGQRSNKAIKSLEDYKGVKMRQCGRVQAKMLEDVGGSAVFMPGGEVYMAIQRGTIDAGEFSVPEVDWYMGFQEITDYWVLPGWHQPGPVWGVLINQKTWDNLSDMSKFKFKEAAMASMMWTWTYFEYGSSEYTNKFVEEGVEINRLEDEVLNKLQDVAWEYMIQDAKKNPDFAKIAFSQLNFFKKMSTWREIQQPFMYGRTPPGLDEALEQVKKIAQDHGVYEEVLQLQEDVRARMKEQKFWTPGTKYVANPVPVD
jgi:TRAP-type mannitol/chloroaromatic compound transport system substrate-binding protein